LESMLFLLKHKVSTKQLPVTNFVVYKIDLHAGIKVTICWCVYYCVGLSGKYIIVTFCSPPPHPFWHSFHFSAFMKWEMMTRSFTVYTTTYWVLDLSGEECSLVGLHADV
jgi:hypothetical protein